MGEYQLHMIYDTTHVMPEYASMREECISNMYTGSPATRPKYPTRPLQLPLEEFMVASFF